MAAPAVSGSIALLLQQWPQLPFSAEPLPSTIKAILIQAALDLDRSGSGAKTSDGPDFVNGWGLLQVKPAVSLIIDDGSTSANLRLIADC